jgi:SAM-dependent methyltransferase
MVGDRDGYALARCGSCSHIFVTNMPDLDTLKEKYELDGAAYDSVPPVVSKILSDVAASFASYRTNNRALEVGFGTGVFLKALRAHGWDALGIEVAESSVAEARRHGITGVEARDLYADDLPAASYDLVVMDGVLEHIPEPLGFLRSARRVLRRGGLLYITTPHGPGISSRMLGVRWSVCCPPDHLHLFSVASLRIALAQTGLRDVDVETKSVNPYELLNALRGRETTNRARVDAARDMNDRLMGSGRGRLVKKFVNKSLDITGLGDQLIVKAEAR